MAQLQPSYGQLSEEKIAQQFISRNSIFKKQRRAFIVRDMTVDNYDTCLIIWNSQGLLRPDFAATVLQSIANNLEIRYEWDEASPQLCKKAVSIFQETSHLEEAVEKLQMLSRSIIAVPYPVFLDALIEADTLHPELNNPINRIIVKGKANFRKGKKLQFESELLEFGECRIRFKKYKDDLNVICEAEYAFAVQAIAAKTILSSFESEGSGILSIDIETTKRIKQIMHYTSNYFENKLCIGYTKSVQWTEMPFLKNKKGKEKLEIFKLIVLKKCIY